MIVSIDELFRRVPNSLLLSRCIRRMYHTLQLSNNDQQRETNTPVALHNVFSATKCDFPQRTEICLAPCERQRRRALQDRTERDLRDSSLKEAEADFSTPATRRN